MTDQSKLWFHRPWTDKIGIKHQSIIDHGFSFLLVSSFIIWVDIDVVTRVTQRVSLVKKELLTILEHLSSPPGYLWVSCCWIFSFLCSVGSCFVFCPFSFCHCIVSFFFLPLHCLSFFFLPLHCLSFFNLQFQITNLVSSNLYYITLLLLFNHYRVRVMVFIATSNNISFILWQSVLLVEEIGVPRENHRPAASHWQTLSHNVVLSTLCLNGIRIHVRGDRHWMHR